MVHILLKSGLENFEHYFASVWDECNCEVVWTFFAIVFLWGWNENWPFPVLWPLLSFRNLLAYCESATFNMPANLTHQWPQDWKRSVFIPIPKKGHAKECSNYFTIALISHTSKVMLKILQARLQMFKLDLERAEEPEIKLPTSVG